MATSRAGRFGALLPATIWRQFGVDHPLAPGHRGHIDLQLEEYDRATLDAAIEAAPEEMLSVATYGTPTQIVENLRGFAEAGMRHVSLLFISAMCSRRAALYSFRAAHSIARALT